MILLYCQSPYEQVLNFCIHIQILKNVFVSIKHTDKQYFV